MSSSTSWTTTSNTTCFDSSSHATPTDGVCHSFVNNSVISKSDTPESDGVFSLATVKAMRFLGLALCVVFSACIGIAVLVFVIITSNAQRDGFFVFQVTFLDFDTNKTSISLSIKNEIDNDDAKEYPHSFVTAGGSGVIHNLGQVTIAQDSDWSSQNNEDYDDNDWEYDPYYENEDIYVVEWNWSEPSDDNPELVMREANQRTYEILGGCDCCFVCVEPGDEDCGEKRRTMSGCMPMNDLKVLTIASNFNAVQQRTDSLLTDKCVDYCMESPTPTGIKKTGDVRVRTKMVEEKSDVETLSMYSCVGQCNVNPQIPEIDDNNLNPQDIVTITKKCKVRYREPALIFAPAAFEALETQKAQYLDTYCAQEGTKIYPELVRPQSLEPFMSEDYCVASLSLCKLKENL